MATEMQKPEDKETHEELPKKTLETVPNKPSLTDHLDDSPNPSTHPSSLQESDEDPLTDGSGKERESPSTETPLGSSADLAAPVSDLQKKILRAERFGMSVQLSEVEKRNSRAERFGTGSNLHGLDEIKKSEEQKKKKRAERFGLPTETAANEEAKKKARLARFAAVSKTDTLEEDKKKARAIRFSKPSSNAPSQLNGLGQTEQKTATVGKDSGGA